MVGFQFQPCHNIIGTQSYGVGRLLAVAFLRLFLPFPALALSLDDWDKRDVYVRRFLVPVKMSRHDVLLAEHEGEVSQIVGTPLVQPSLSFDALHIFVRSRHVDTDCPHLVTADFACQPGFLQSSLYGCRTVFHSIGVADELSVKVRACGVGVFRYDETLDVGGRSAVGTVRLFHV